MLTYMVQLHSETFGVTPVKGARSRVTPCPGRGDRRAMLVDISPPVGTTRAVGVQVVQGRRRGRGDGLGTWVCEQRMSEPKTCDQRRSRDSSGAAEEGGTTADG